jgi:hypothetical protein
MLDIGRALRVIVHLNADVSSSNEFLHNDILAFLYERGVAGATVFRPEAGFGSHHRLHTKGAPGSEGPTFRSGWSLSTNKKSLIGLCLSCFFW